MQTIALSQPDTAMGGWDLVVRNGRLQFLQDDAALAQRVACAEKVFQGEMFFDITYGLPWLPQVLTKGFNGALLRAAIEAQAKTVPEVVKAKATIQGFSMGQVRATVRFTDAAGVAASVQL